MTGEMKKLLDKTVLIVEFAVFAAFAFSTCLLYYALTNQAPVPPENRLDDDFVPFVLLLSLLFGASVTGLIFLIHFTGCRIIKIKEKREAAKRFG